MGESEISELFHEGGYPIVTFPGWQFINTGISHTIIIPTGANPNINGTALIAGDYVGVFYDSLGALACAGYERWTGSGSIAISAFGDDPTSGSKDGFSSGEVFRWKIFRANGGIIYDAEATYSPTGGVVTHTNTYASNGISQLMSLAGGLSTHNVTLRSGWGLISSYVIPQSTTLDNIFAGVSADLIIMKNGAQKNYIPSVPVNTIGPWVNTEGYQVKMANARAVGFMGQKIVPWALTIGLPLGWSIMPYVRDADMLITSALSGVVSDVVIVKDQDGKTYIPSVGVNGIGALKVGQGYQVKMATARTIEYPANTLSEPLVSYEEASTSAKQSNAGPPWFYTNTGTSHTCIVQLSVNPAIDGMPITVGDYIGVFYDSSGVMACAGYERWTDSSNVAIAAFGNDATTSVQEGLASGEVLKWKIWRGSDNRTFTGRALYVPPGGLGGIVTDTSKFSPNGISAIATLTASVSSVTSQEFPTQNTLMQNYPNPFNPSTTIAFGLPERSFVRLTVYNTLGEQVAELVGGHLDAGYHDVVFDCMNLSSGVYFYRLQVRDFVQTKRMLLLQ